MSSKRDSWLSSNWSQQEREAFVCALDAGDAFVEPGLGANWSERTREHAELAYGRYREFCVRTGRLTTFKSFEQVFRMDWIKAYYDDLRPALAPKTVLKALRDFAMAIRAMAPSIDRSQLLRVLNKIERRAENTRPIAENIVAPPEILELARSMILAAEGSKVQRKNAAKSFRDGAMLMAFAYCPLRMKNWCTCVIGENLLLDEQPGRLKFERHELKWKRAPRGETLPPELDKVLRRYIEVYRPRFLMGGVVDSGVLWLSRSGRPMSADVMSERIRTIMQAKKEKRFGPHMFRHSAATFIAESAPHMIGIAQGVLGHGQFRTTSDNYVHVRYAHAVRKYQGAVRDLMKRRGNR